MVNAVRKTVTTVVTDGAADGANTEEFYLGDPWEVIQRIHSAEKTIPWRNHMARVYRADDKWEKAGAPENNKFLEPFTEDTVRERFGGGRYVVWVYGPPGGTKVVLKPVKVEIEGPAKYSTPGSSATPGVTSPSDPLTTMIMELLTEIRAMRGGTAPADAMKTALEIQKAGFSSAIESMKSVTPVPAAGPASPMNDMWNRVMEMMLMKMLQPDPFQSKVQEMMMTRMMNPADPIETFKTMAAAVQTMVPGAPAGKADLMGAFVNSLPTILDKGVGAVREYRMATESQERMFTLQRTPVAPVQTVIEVPAAPIAQTASVPAAAPTPAPVTIPAQPKTTEVVEVSGPSKEWILLNIVQKVQTIDATGEELFLWLDAVAPEFVDELAALDKDTLLLFFRSPMMQQAKLGNTILSTIGNDPKLPRLIDEFLTAVKDANSETVKPKTIDL